MLNQIQREEGVVNDHALLFLSVLPVGYYKFNPMNLY